MFEGKSLLSIEYIGCLDTLSLPPEAWRDKRLLKLQVPPIEHPHLA